MLVLALANNDVVQLFWQVEAKLLGCLGFTVDHREGKGDWTPLPAWVGFQGQSNNRQLGLQQAQKALRRLQWLRGHWR